MSLRAAGWSRVLVTVGVVVLIDQVTKAWVVSELMRGEERNFFFLLDITYVRNDGVAFGAFAGGGLVLVLLIGGALAALLGYFAVNAGKPLLWLPTGMLLGGAVGNLIDRAREGAVTDFIDPEWWPAFNIADVVIVVGVLLLFYVAEGRKQEA